MDEARATTELVIEDDVCTASPAPLSVGARSRIRRKRNVRAAVFARDLGLCRYCRRVATTIDHVKPRARGGRHSMANCVASCWPCNKRKGNKSPEQVGMKLLPVPVSVPAGGTD